MEIHSCKCQSAKQWQQASDTPVAWLVLTHNITLERSIILLHKIWRPHHTYVVHVDKSVPHVDLMIFVKKIHEQFQSHDNIFVISKFIGGHKHELVEIELEMIRTIVRPWPSLTEMEYYYQKGVLPNTLLSSDMLNNTCGVRRWEYAAILSGDSYPLQDIDVIVRRIACSYSSINPLGMIPAHLDATQIYKRIVKPMNGEKILKELESAYRKCGDSRKANQLNALAATKGVDGVVNKKAAKSLAKVAPVYKGHQWVVLTRNFVEYSVTSEFAKRLFEVLKYISYAGDEHYFQSLLFASCRNEFFDDLITNHSNEKEVQFMYTPWTASGYVLTPDLVQQIHDEAMFARKVRSPDTEQAIKSRILIARDFEEEYLHYCHTK